MVEQLGLRIGLGDSVDYRGDADLVFSHLYGPLPPQLVGKPAIVNVFGNKHAKAEQWCGAVLHQVSKWGSGLSNTIYVANVGDVPRVDLTDLVEDEFAPRRGWFPLELCERMFDAVSRGTASVGDRVFDGFMGRGTVGKMCQRVGVGFVGIDRDPDRIAIAREYLGC